MNASLITDALFHKFLRVGDFFDEDDTIFAIRNTKKRIIDNITIPITAVFGSTRVYEESKGIWTYKILDDWGKQMLFETVNYYTFAQSDIMKMEWDEEFENYRFITYENEIVRGQNLIHKNKMKFFYHLMKLNVTYYRMKNLVLSGIMKLSKKRKNV